MAKDVIKLKASNSSGNQNLVIEYDNSWDEVFLTLYGEHNGKHIQIDFDGLNDQQFSDLRKYVNRVDRKIKRSKSE